VTSNREERGTLPGNDLSRAAWRKSTYSGGNGSCVEVAGLGGAVAVRDSKNPDGPKLILTQDTWRAFVRSVKAAG
jgi:hypothetical protein